MMEQMMNPTYIAAFDLDKTILSVNSAKLVVQVSRKAGIMQNKDFRMAVWYSVLYKLDLCDPNKLVHSMALWLKGLKEEYIREIIDTRVIPQVLAHIRPEIKEEMDAHRKRGGRLVLLSSAMNYLCEPVVRHLDMDDLVCSRMEVRNGLFTGHPHGKLVFGKEKLKQMKDYCSTKNFDLDRAWYYGDAMTDRFILEGVGNPVCVKPELALRRLAKRKNWTII